MNSFTKKLRILFVENSNRDFALILSKLHHAGYEPIVEQISTADGMRAALQKNSWDIILCDHSLPQFNSTEALRIYKKSGLEIPFIVVSGTMNDDLAAKAMSSGAHDYVSKNNLVRLIPVIQRELRHVELRTQHKQAEDALRESEAHLRAMVEATPECVKVIDHEGLVVEMNRAGLKMIECDDLALVKGQCVYSIIAEEHREAFRTLNEKVCGGEQGFLQFDLVGFRGTRRSMETHAVPIPGPDGALRQLSITRDITSRLSLEAQFRQSQKMESVGQLAGGVAHDFNNILTIIQGHSSLMLSSATMTQNDRDSAQQISIAAERAANLTRQLLTFSRRQIIQTRALDLNAVVNGVSQMLRRVLGEDISLHVNFGSSVPLLQADHGMVEQILMNLAVNSRDAMPQGGHLTISTSTQLIDPSYVQQNPEASAGEAICLSVSDTGCGIATEDLPRIFEPFFTTKSVGKGTGLGLATVYGIVKQHSGWITVESKSGKGTAFQIYFPNNQKKIVKPEIAPENLAPRGGSETILLVEDESPVRHLVKNILKQLGYSILEAESGVAALKLWKLHRDKIHLLLTDMIMPDGISGRELAEIVQFDRPDIKVIFTSGYNAEIVGKDFSLHEGLNFLQKPYPPKKLAKAVRDCLDESLAA